MANQRRAATWRVLHVLDAFGPTRRKLSLTDVARHCGLPVSTTHRLVAMLVSWGGLVRDVDGRYGVGQRLWEVGLLADVQSELKLVAAPFLQDLYSTTRETIYLAIREGDRALYIDRLAGKIRPPVLAEVGSVLPLHATGVGKVLLAAAPESVLARVLSDLRPVTGRTIVDPDRLAAQLESVRQRGFARTVEEMGPGTASVAVPIRRHPNEVIAAIGLVTADLRRDLSRLVPALQVTASGIARNLLFH